jgi:hypothetical protein
MGIVAFSALSALALARLAHYGVDARNVVVAGLSRWAYHVQVRALGVGLLVGMYVAYVRPFLFQSFHYALGLDWAIAVAVVVGVALLTGGQVNRMRYARQWDEAWLMWRRHELEVTDHPHEQMGELVRVQQAFAQHGIKEDLLVYLVAYLRDNRLPLRAIVAMVQPIVNYTEARPPRLALWGALGKHRARCTAERSVLLGDVIGAIAARVPEMEKAPVVRQSLRTLQGTPPTGGRGGPEGSDTALLRRRG